MQNPRVALLLDHYEETWEKLAYLLVQGTAKVVEQGSEREDALALLRKKYPQYQCMDLNAAPVIQITPTRFVAWGALKEA